MAINERKAISTSSRYCHCQLENFVTDKWGKHFSYDYPTWLDKRIWKEATRVSIDAPLKRYVTTASSKVSANLLISKKNYNITNKIKNMNVIMSPAHSSIFTEVLQNWLILELKKIPLYWLIRYLILDKKSLLARQPITLLCDTQIAKYFPSFITVHPGNLKDHYLFSRSFFSIPNLIDERSVPFKMRRRLRLFLLLLATLPDGWLCNDCHPK
uniref:Uncharacterized protein n=1 Tax=Heterorhabditis bacteriophora TaxID=37862 RepID=A0A1I7WK23_HETBA